MSLSLYFLLQLCTQIRRSVETVDDASAVVIVLIYTAAL